MSPSQEVEERMILTIEDTTRSSTSRREDLGHNEQGNSLIISGGLSNGSENLAHVDDRIILAVFHE